MSERDAIEQLAALLDGRVDVTDAPSSLGALATLAETVRDHADLMAPTPEFRAALREELVAAPDPAPEVPGLAERLRLGWARRTANLRQSARVAVATMTASSLIGSAGVAVAAQAALPGDMLYGLKGVTEDARLLLATSDVAQARLHLAFARERLAELQASATRLSADEVVALLAEMDAHSTAGAEALIDGASAGGVDPVEVRDFAADQRDGLVAVFGDLPLLAKPVAEDSLELLRRIGVRASGVMPVAECACDPVADQRRLKEAARGEDARGTGPMSLLPTETVISAPGEGPAVPGTECDCVDLPGGPATREPSSQDTSDSDTRTGEEEPEEEPFRPTGELTSPEADNDDEPDGEEPSGIDAPISGEDVPVDKTTESLETSTGVEVDTDAVDRLTGSAEDSGSLGD